MSLPLTDDAGVVQTKLEGVPVVWNAGLGYDANGLLCVTATVSPDDVWQGGRRISHQGLLVVSESTPAGQPWDYNAGWPFDKITGAVISQSGAPASTDPRVSGIAIGPLGGIYMTETAGGWDPSMLWPTPTSKGLWISPRTTAASFQDSAGTTALSAIGTVADSSNPIGLQLDLSKGLVLGAVAYSTSTFAGWTLLGATTVVAGDLTLTAVSSGEGGYFSAGLVAGKYYEVTFEIVSISPGTFICATAGILQGDIFGETAVGVYTHRMLASDEYVRIYGFSLTASTAVISSVSVTEIPGIHLSNATSAARPVASGRKNTLVGTATLSTQSVTVTAIPYTISFAGAGTVTASGTHVGALTNGQTFTPTAGTLTLTVAGSVTTAQLERGSTVTSYQAVVSDSSYTASAGPTFVRMDGADDALASATFPADTLSGTTDALMAVRRDSAANAILVYQTAGGGKFIGCVESGSASQCTNEAGAATVWVDDVQLTGGTAVTRDTLHTALTSGAWHVLEFRGLNLSAWDQFQTGNFTGYNLNGALGDIMLFESGQDANRDKAREYMADYYGIALPAWVGRYNYVTPPFSNIPVAGDIDHGDNLLNKLNFSKTDLDGQTYTGPALTTGHEVKIGDQVYTLVAPPVDFGTYATLTIEPATQLPEGIYTVLVY